MLATAAVAMTAGADFVVERAVDLVLLRAKDGGQVVRHGGILCVALALAMLMLCCVVM